MVLSTYRNGFRMKVPAEGFATTQMPLIYEQCTALFGVPCKASDAVEGGIDILVPTGKKTMRFWIKPRRGSYEIINFTKYERDGSVIPRGAEVQTFLKAFHGAPVWTVAELRSLQKIFETYGFKILKTTFPSEDSLSYDKVR